LGHPLPAKFVDFDVVTNFGCTEHIKGHYHAWKNMHEACRIDGLMIHALPEEGSWLGHGRVLYQEDRVSNLAHACGYHTVILRRHEWQKRGHSENLIHCCFQRMSTPFVSEEVFEDLMHGKGEQ